MKMSEKSKQFKKLRPFYGKQYIWKMAKKFYLKDNVKLAYGLQKHIF